MSLNEDLSIGNCSILYGEIGKEILPELSIKEAVSTERGITIELCQNCSRKDRCENRRERLSGRDRDKEHATTQQNTTALTIGFRETMSHKSTLQLNLDHLGKCRNLECRARVFPLLYQMSRVIAESANLGQTLVLLQQIMEREMNFVCGMITLHHQRSGRIMLHESFA
nr:hypothetical protein [uncultured Desulfuromonas sp.]